MSNTEAQSIADALTESIKLLRQKELKKQSKMSGVLLAVVFEDGSSCDAVISTPGHNLQLIGATHMTLLSVQANIASESGGA